MAEPALAPAAPAHLYALVDLARAPQLLPLIDTLTRAGAARCLFEGPIAEPLRRASPHIVAAARAPHLMERWHAEGRGQSWGVFLETPLPLHLARRHVRRFLQVKLPDGSGPVLMRLWDPRVAGPVLDRADPAQRTAYSAGGCTFLVEAGADRMVRFGAAGAGAGRWPGLSRAVA